jgi:hypothetical protein
VIAGPREAYPDSLRVSQAFERLTFARRLVEIRARADLVRRVVNADASIARS